MFTDPTVADFKAYFVRDFPYADAAQTDLTKVLDSDITSALADTKQMLNTALASDQTNYTLLYLLLTAHNLVMNLRASSQGIAGNYSWLASSKSVGSVAESFAIPQRILDNPMLAIYTKTFYGTKYISLVLPKLSGQMFAVCGRTNP